MSEFTGNSMPIGNLTPEGDHYAVVGPCCKNKREVQAPIYAVNILPYRQSCICCGRTLVEGQSPAWPELFDGTRPCSGCGTTDHGPETVCPRRPEDDGTWICEDDGPIRGYDF